jgi:predicted amidohydrolase YtcJ
MMKENFLIIDAQGISQATLSLTPSDQTQGNSFAILEDIHAKRAFPKTTPSSLRNILIEGFYDSHMHPSWMANLKSRIDLRHENFSRSIELIRAQSHKALIYAYGWSEDRWEMTLQNEAQQLAYLNAHINQDLNIFLLRACGHKAYVTQKAQEEFKLKKQFLHDEELEKIRIPRPDIDTQLDAVFEDLRATGITSCADLLVSYEDFLLFSEEHKKNCLLFANIKELDLYSDIPKASLPKYMKFFLDGSLGARTAWLTQCYSDLSDTFGKSLWPMTDLINHSRAALKKGFLLSFHAIGDAALDQALALGEILKEEMQQAINIHSGNASFLHRIEHLQVCRDDQIETLKNQAFWSLGLQPSHRIADKDFSIHRLGDTRLETQGYRLKSFLQLDLPLSLGSDAPVVDFNPTITLKAIEEDSRNSEKISTLEALELFCVKGRQNTGLSAKILDKNSKVYLLRDVLI